MTPIIHDNHNREKAIGCRVIAWADEGAEISILDMFGVVATLDKASAVQAAKAILAHFEEVE